MLPEDGRAAAALKTTLACAVIASAFGAIAVQAAIAVFVVDKRQGIVAFGICAVAATLLLLCSAILGAQGVAKVYKEGYKGNWIGSEGKENFSLQALTGGLGILLIVTSTFLGSPKADTPKEPADYSILKNKVNKLQYDLDNLKKSTQETASSKQVPSSGTQPKTTHVSPKTKRSR